MSGSSTVVRALALASLAALGGCAPRAHLCTATTECTTGAACVAGRCQPERPGTKPSIEAGRRLVFRPVDMAYVRRGGGGVVDPARSVLPGAEEAEGEGGVPSHVVLGRASEGGVLFLRFAAELPRDAKVIEAYLVLRRASTVDDDPAPIHLHATRIVAGWNSRSTSFARQPRLEDVALPSTRVEAGGPALVRLDVRELVTLWGRRDRADHGVAVVATTESPTGTTFALAGGSGSGAGGADPYLEMYVR